VSGFAGGQASKILAFAQILAACAAMAAAESLGIKISSLRADFLTG
jgi:hypothetical protein